MKKVVVVDYGSGNLRSVSKALEAVAGSDASVVVSSDPAAVRAADRIVLPGQGAMADCMHHLLGSGLADVVRDALVDLARERFAPSWGDLSLVSPTQDAEEAIRRAFKATR